jgi:octaprenyl-diphosphate synthase
MTLPLIYLLNHSGFAEKRWIVNTVKNHNTEPARVAELIGKVRASGGIGYAHEKMLENRQMAIDLLRTFPENTYRNSLEQLVIFTTERNK